MFGVYLICLLKFKGRILIFLLDFPDFVASDKCKKHIFGVVFLQFLEQHLSQTS